MAITGGSAGGWTVLCALAFHPTCSRPAPTTTASPTCSGFVDDTHKFESRYNDWLVGPWPEAAELWRERSPINHADRIRAPVIILQGLEDKVVPPSQSELDRRRAARATASRTPTSRFEGEQHGFRKADNAQARRRGRARRSTRQVFGFEPAGDIEPVPIEGR